MYNVQVHGSSISGNQCFVCFFSILICFVLLYDVTLCRRARDLPGLPDMSRCQNNVCNKNQKLKSYHNAVLHGRERERESVPCARACKAASRASALSTRPVHRCTSRDSCTAHPTTDTHTTAPESGPDLPAFPAGTRTTDVGPLATGFTANGVYSDC